MYGVEYRDDERWLVVRVMVSEADARILTQAQLRKRLGEHAADHVRVALAQLAPDDAGTDRPEETP